METNALFDQLFNLNGKVAVVTGASKGLGKTMAETLAQSGAKVAICSRNHAEIQSVAKEISEKSGQVCLGFETDVSNQADLDTFFANVRKDLGPIDILIANAGIVVRRDSMELTEQDWDDTLNINLKGAFFCAKAVWPEMIKQKWGRIVFLGSIMSFVSHAGRAAYSSSKAAISGLTKTLALEGASHGICVNAICPGPFLTPNNMVIYEDEEANRAFIKKVPAGRWGQPDEIAGLTLYLSSPACSFMTGSTILIDGGWTSQ